MIHLLVLFYKLLDSQYFHKFNVEFFELINNHQIFTLVRNVECKHFALTHKTIESTSNKQVQLLSFILYFRCECIPSNVCYFDKYHYRSSVILKDRHFVAKPCIPVQKVIRFQDYISILTRSVDTYRTHLHTFFQQHNNFPKYQIKNRETINRFRIRVYSIFSPRYNYFEVL